MVRQIDNDQMLRELTRVLVDTLDPDRIILFGSRARGTAREDSDYDLAVEIDAPDYRELQSVAREAAQRAAGRAEVDIHLRQTGDVEARRDDPGYMEWDIAREGIVLYTAPDRPRRVRERPPAKSSVVGWLDRTKIDLKMVDLGLGAPEIPWEGVCFHAQQAAEKYLKAAIVTAGIRPERTHKLAALVEQLRETGAALPDLRADCEALANYAVEIRYPDDTVTMPATRDEGERAVTAMRSIIAAVVPFIRSD